MNAIVPSKKPFALNDLVSNPTLTAQTTQKESGMSWIVSVIIFLELVRVKISYQLSQLLLWRRSSAEHCEGHPVCASTPVQVQVQVHCIGWEDCACTTIFNYPAMQTAALRLWRVAVSVNTRLHGYMWLTLSRLWRNLKLDYFLALEGS